MMKRFVSLILVLLLTFPAAAYAEEVKKCDDWLYVAHNDGTARIVAYEGTEELVFVPDVVAGYTVTGFSDYIAGRNYGFQLTSAVTLLLPDSFTEIGSDMPFLFSRLTKFEVVPNHPTFKTIDGVLFNKEGTELLIYPPARVVDVYRIPNGVKNIHQYAFADAKIGVLVCPDSLQISNDAFGFASVEEIVYLDTSFLCRFCNGVGKMNCPYCEDGKCVDCYEGEKLHLLSSAGDYELTECNLCDGWGLCRIDCNKGAIDCKYCNGSGYNVSGEALAEALFYYMLQTEARLSED